MTQKTGIAAPICCHLTDGAESAAFAVKDAPVGAFDSGWQILCCNQEYHARDMRVVGLENVLGLFPSFQKIMDLPVGTKANTANKKSDWVF